MDLAKLPLIPRGLEIHLKSITKRRRGALGKEAPHFCICNPETQTTSSDVSRLSDRRDAVQDNARTGVNFNSLLKHANRSPNLCDLANIAP